MGPGRCGRPRTGDRTIAKNLRFNEQIRISPIRLIDEADNQIGIIDVREAMQRAQQAGMDLVEVAPDARPPVCRIMDYGKWKYGQSKKEQKSKAHRKETELKEIRINLVVRTRDEDPRPQFKVGQEQVTGNRDPDTLVGGDGYRRRIYSSAVRLRNLEG